MMNQISQAGLPARPALAFLLLDMILLSPLVAAQTGNRSRVSDSILGVRIGMSLEDARKQLEPLSIPAARATNTDEDDDEGGTKRYWSMKGTNYSSVALKTNAKGLVVWVTGFVRPSKELLFSELGDTSLAVRATDSQAIWNVATKNGGYRLVVKGQNGRARVIYFLSLATLAR
jgi:hypothetical protein